MEIENIWDVMRARHSVRHYLDKAIEPELAERLRTAIAEINAAEPRVRFELVTDEPEAFRAGQPSYGNFRGCRNYIVLCGKRGADEAVGYHGEELVLLAQSLGLGSCWVALTFEKDKVTVAPPAGMKLFDLIALGYVEDPGHPHRSKPVIKLAKITPDTPQWFEAGMDAAMLAPTAINQQRFFFEQVGERGVKARALLGPCSKTDLGIVKLHFELGAGKENFEWK